MKKYKVAIVDDHVVVRMGIRFAVGMFKDLDFVGEFSRGEGAAEFVNGKRPDVTILDLRMPDRDGTLVLADILKLWPEAKVVILSSAGTEEDVYKCLSLGAKGYVLKDGGQDNLIAAIRVVAEGGEFIPDDIRRVYKERMKAPELTPREHDVLALLAEGLSNDDIAERLGVTRDGVKIHLKHVYEKLGVGDRVSAVNESRRRGLIV